MTIAPEQISYPALPIISRTGAEPFHADGKTLGSTLLDFWRWASSDLISNTMRGILAEYLVANALNLPQTVRPEWQPFDLKTDSGLKIEVKSAAYLQAWHHAKLSAIRFGIQPTLAWDAKTNSTETTRKRQADLYVFCLLHHQDKQTIDPMNVGQWRFYILPASVLNEQLPAQKTISLANLLKLQPIHSLYSEIKSLVEQWEHNTAEREKSSTSSDSAKRQASCEEN